MLLSMFDRRMWVMLTLALVLALTGCMTTVRLTVREGGTANVTLTDSGNKTTTVSTEATLPQMLGAQ